MGEVYNHNGIRQRNGHSGDEIPLLLTNTDRVHKKGSGVELVNVKYRIKILFGERYPAYRK